MPGEVRQRLCLGRGERIRTSDHRYPIPVRYRTAPRPEEHAIAPKSIKHVPAQHNSATRVAGTPGKCRTSRQEILLDLGLGASLFQLRLGGLGLFLGDGLLDGLRRGIDEVLRLLEAKAGQLADRLDDLDLVRADFREDDVELGLLFLGGSASATGGRTSGTSNGDRSSGGNAPLLLERLDELVELEDGHTLKSFDDLSLIG